MGKLDFQSLEGAAYALLEQAKPVQSIASRADVAAIFEHDRLHGITDRHVVQALSASIAHWIVWEQQPTGVISAEDCDWLIALVGERPTHFGRTVLFAVVRDAEKVPERLSAHAMRAAVNRALLI